MADLTPAAYFPEDCVITIQQKGLSTQTITTRVMNFTTGGGTRDTETFAHFGGAFVTVRKPREEFEVSFDITVNDTFYAELMGGTKTGAGSTFGSAFMIQSQGSQVPCKIKLEWFDTEAPQQVGSTAGSDYGAGYKILFYNAYAVEFTRDNSADEFIKGTINFNLGAANNVGSGQMVEIECQNFQDSIGSGSYVAWETTEDTLFGYS